MSSSGYYLFKCNFSDLLQKVLLILYCEKKYIQKGMLGLAGISYKSADLEIRECFAFTKEDIQLFSKNILKHNSIYGVVILSTCNRTEIYYHFKKELKGQANKAILEELTLMKSYSPDYSSYFYFKENKDLVIHLFRVVSGIESLIVGEDQIIGQVKDAFYYAEELKTTDKILKRLFTKAFEVGKKVKTQTQISRGSASASSAAVNLCFQHYSDFSRLNFLMIGAGQTGQLVLNSLKKSKLGNLIVSNRTLSRAKELANHYQGNSIALNKINTVLPDADIIFVATDAPQPLLTKKMLEAAIEKRKRPYLPLLFDLSVPRNIEESVSRMNSVDLYTIDDLQQIVASTNKKRLKEIAAAMKIIEKAEHIFSAWHKEQDLIPAILKIKTSFQSLNKKEKEEFMRIRSIKEHELLEEYSNHITEKFARVFIKNLKNISKDADKKSFIEMAQEFFDMD